MHGPLRLIRLAAALSLAATLGLMAAAVHAQTELRFYADDPAIVYRGQWEPGPVGLDERPARQSSFAGAAAVLTYSGPWVSWLTSVGPDRGKVRVIIDGQVRDDALDLYSPTPAEKEFRWSSLTTAANHTIEVIVLGDRNEASSSTIVVHRGFLAPGAPVPPTLTAPAPAEVQPPAAQEGAPAQPAVTAPAGLRFFADDPALSYRGEWEPGPVVSGERPARQARFSNASVGLTYSGPWVSWLTSVGPDRGKVRVIIDGQVRDEDLDLYSPTPAEKEFRWSTLTTAANHTIEIVVLGDRNEESSGTTVVNRGFLAPGAPVPPTLTVAAPAAAAPPAAEAPPQPQPQQVPIPVQVAPGVSFYLATDPALTYSAEWQTVPARPASGTLPALPSLRSAEARPATVGFTFYGPSVTWYTLVGPDRGKVRVTIDGEVRDEEVDLYSPQEQIRAFAWSVLDPNRLHRIEITVLQDRNPSSQGVLVAVLGFATPRAPLPPMAPAA